LHLAPPAKLNRTIGVANPYLAPSAKEPVHEKKYLITLRGAKTKDFNTFTCVQQNRIRLFTTWITNTADRTKLLNNP
jgi:hypothetical protein